MLKNCTALSKILHIYSNSKNSKVEIFSGFTLESTYFLHMKF